MRISIFGLGYVGAVCAGCLSARGHDVVGVDVAKDKIDMINAGKSPIVEPGLGELLAQGIETGRLRGTTNFAEAIRDTDLSMICVGTPSKKNGDLELNYIEAVCREIGFVLRENPPATPSWCAAPCCRVPSPTWSSRSSKTARARRPVSISASRSTRNSCVNPPRSRTTTCHR